MNRRRARSTRSSRCRRRMRPAQVRRRGERCAVPEPSPSDGIGKPNDRSAKARSPRVRHPPRSSPTVPATPSVHPDRAPNQRRPGWETTRCHNCAPGASCHIHPALCSPPHRRRGSAVTRSASNAGRDRDCSGRNRPHAANRTSRNRADRCRRSAPYRLRASGNWSCRRRLRRRLPTPRRW